MFKFTFSVGNGSSNPFATQAEERERVQQAVAPQTIRRKLPAPPKRPLPPPSTSEDVPRAKKRGWVPANSSASEAMSQPTLTNGYIDTPAKYLNQASQSHDNGDEDDMDGDLPPAKRRKTLTDSIISTAFSAALIGTAVGMTAYRMWRDRGKPGGETRPETVEQPPPPYLKEEWVDDSSHNMSASRAPRLPKKPRSTARRAPRHRRAPITISPARSPARSTSPLRFATPQQEERRDDQGELEDQMDWMGDKLRRLIEEGQKALGKEVVVMNGEQINEEEGAVDDGMEGWEEENGHGAGPSSATSSTFSRSWRRPSKRLTTNTSTSPPSLFGHAFPASYGSVPTSPRTKRSWTTAGGGHSQIPSGPGSPYLGVATAFQSGGRPSPGIEDVNIIYEPGAISTDFHPTADHDEDSRRLTEGMDAIRKAYRFH